MAPRVLRGGQRLPGDAYSVRQRREALRYRRLQECIVVILVLVAVTPMIVYMRYSSARRSRAGGNEYDAIVVPGGGITTEGGVTPWVRGRLDLAAELFDRSPEARIILLSRGTPHKPPPLDDDRRPIDEAFVSAEYLRARGVPPDRLLQDSWSMDTIGNALFLRLMHLEPRRLARVAIITNEFHSGRVRAVFDWVLHLPPRLTKFETHYVDAPDVGLTDQQLIVRREKEAASLDKLRLTIEQIRTVEQLHAFIFERHGAYATGIARVPVSKELAASY